MKHLILLIALAFIAYGEEPIKEGHSHQGHAFNEGPRQAGSLMKGTGKVHFPITTSWDQGQDYFHQGIGQLHGFWYYEAERSFRKLLAHDPDCPMAYWGLAMANWENEKRAKSFIESATKLIETAEITDREKAYIKAQASFYDNDPKDVKKRRKELLKDLENIVLDHPKDLEAKAFLVCRNWQMSQKGIPISSHVGLDALLEQIFAKAPLHPAHHYAIHLWDYRRAKEALASAAKLGSTAPSIAHMWHMPGHIYSKLNRHADAAWQQQASARIDHAHMAKNLLIPDQIHNYAHNNEWLSRNFTHLGNAPASIAMAKSLLANPRHPKLNTLKGKAHSYKYGRNALLKSLETFELWQDALSLSETQWLPPLPAHPREELKRQRLLAIAHFHLNGREKLLTIIRDLVTQKKHTKALQKSDKDEARKKATDENKDIKKAVQAANKKHQPLLKSLDKILPELRGYYDQLNGKKTSALASLKHSASPANAKALRQLSMGDKDAAEKQALKTLESDKKQTVPLAQAIYILHTLGKTEETKQGFEKLQKHSSQIHLTSPAFQRLAPIAKELELPSNWTKPHENADDILPRPELDTLGPLHWTPPTATSFSLPDQHSKPHTLAQFQGKPLILIFYLGHGCLHCTEQLTAIADRYPDFESAKLPVLAISTDDVSNLKNSHENYKKGTIPFPIVSDHNKGIFKSYTAHDDFEDQPLHGTFLISPKGQILWSDVSADPFMDLNFLLEEFPRLIKLHQ